MTENRTISKTFEDFSKWEYFYDVSIILSIGIRIWVHVSVFVMFLVFDIFLQILFLFCDIFESGIFTVSFSISVPFLGF